MSTISRGDNDSLSHIDIDPGTLFLDSQKQIKNLDELEDLLFNRNVEDPNYGSFDKDLTHSFNHDKSVVKVSFFNEGSESLLSDIYQKNKAEGMGNIKIPESEIELVNYTVCPNCKSHYSFEETQAYYRNPVVPPGENRMEFLRVDTRFLCSECNTYFLPALVMVDKTPKSECQFLCRLQTIDAIEKFYFDQYKKAVLTQSKKSRKENGNQFCVLNDIKISEMKEVPTLVSNFIQYTPYNLILNFIQEEHYMKDPVYGKWMNMN